MDTNIRDLKQPPVVSCRLIGPELEARKNLVTEDLFAHAESIEELIDGVALKFADQSTWLAEITQFVELERQCCPFIQFEIIVEPENGPIWLRLIGSAEVKAFIQHELKLNRVLPDTTN